MAKDPTNTKLPESLVAEIAEYLQKERLMIALGDFRGAAEGILGAIYAPTDAMLAQAGKHGLSRSKAICCWTSMIDTAPSGQARTAHPLASSIRLPMIGVSEDASL